MKKLIGSMLLYFFLPSYCFSQQYIAIVNSTSKANADLVLFSFRIEYYKKDTISVVQKPPIYQYDTLSFQGLDSIYLMREIKARYKEFKLISYSVFSQMGNLIYEFTHDIQTHLESCPWCDKQETFYSENGNKINRIFSISRDQIEKLNRELSSSETVHDFSTKVEFLYNKEKIAEELIYTNNKIKEKITFYDNGIVKEISHFKNEKMVGAYQHNLRNGGLSTLKIFDENGILIFNYNVQNGGYKLNGQSFNNDGEQD